MARPKRPTYEGASAAATRQRRYRQRLKQRHLMEVNGTPAEWVPESPAQLPPYGPGNQAGVRHGARTAAIRDPVAEELKVWAASQPGNEYLREERNAFALNDWAQAQARVLLMQAYASGQAVDEALAEITEIEETVERPSPGVERRYTRAKSVVATWKALESAERHARQAADRIGLSPLARMKLGKQAQAASADLALIWAAQDDEETG
jgi:hypothetical protein